MDSGEFILDVGAFAAEMDAADLRMAGEDECRRRKFQRGLGRSIF